MPQVEGKPMENDQKFTRSPQDLPPRTPKGPPGHCRIRIRPTGLHDPGLPRSPGPCQRRGGRPMAFMVDTGAEHSMATHLLAPSIRMRRHHHGGHWKHHNSALFTGEELPAGVHLVTHEFLYLPDCPVLMLRRDLLTKLRAQISFDSSGLATLTVSPAKILTIIMPREEECQIFTPREALATHLENLPG